MKETYHNDRSSRLAGLLGLASSHSPGGFARQRPRRSGAPASPFKTAYEPFLPHFMMIKLLLSTTWRLSVALREYLHPRVARHNDLVSLQEICRLAGQPILCEARTNARLALRICQASVSIEEPPGPLAGLAQAGHVRGAGHDRQPRSARAGRRPRSAGTRHGSLPDRARPATDRQGRGGRGRAPDRWFVAAPDRASPVEAGDSGRGSRRSSVLGVRITGVCRADAEKRRFRDRLPA